jgi:hypothetical protein
MQNRRQQGLTNLVIINYDGGVAIGVVYIKILNVRKLNSYKMRRKKVTKI